MRQRGIVLAKFFPECGESFFRLALARNNSKGPIGDFLLTGEPFVRPGKENCSGQTALHHTIDMPAEHFGLLLLRMPDCVHPKLTQNQWPFFRQVLQSQ